MNRLNFSYGNLNREYEPGRTLELAFEALQAHGVSDSRLGRCRAIHGAQLVFYKEDIKHLIDNMQFSELALIENEHKAVLNGVLGPLSQEFKLPPSTKYALAVQNLPRLIERLKDDCTSRQAVWFIDYLSCWTSFQLQVSNGTHLNAIFNARSVDFDTGLPSDLLFWVKHVVEPACAALGVEQGMTVLNIGNLHTYNTRVQK